jgi:hypothetical protein
MAEKIGIGDKCIIIKSAAGNEGKIVLVTGYFNPALVKWDGCYVHKDATILATSLGSSLSSVKGKLSQTGVFIPEHLRKLPAVDEPDLSLRIEA